MYKKTVKYTNIDGEAKQRTLYFNYNAIELVTVLEKHGVTFDKMEEFQSYLKSLQEKGKTMEMVRFVHDLIVGAYGERDESGEHFLKSEKIAYNFDHSMVFDEFFLDMMKNPAELNKLMRGSTAGISSLSVQSPENPGLKPLN
jgi:hypothetical protein